MANTRSWESGGRFAEAFVAEVFFAAWFPFVVLLVAIEFPGESGLLRSGQV